MSNVDYGPLTGLIGRWHGSKGEDIAPLPDGTETNSYRENIVFSAAGDLDNAETQELVAVHYHQLVNRISDDKKIHDQTGYWIWDAEAELVMHSFTIPRGVTVLAGGRYEQPSDLAGSVLTVSASLDSSNWTITQSPFMKGNALTMAFSQTMNITSDCLSYEQTTLIDIYGKMFEHTDRNDLVKE